jgi:hypothetical protein
MEDSVYLFYGGNPMDTIPDMIFTEPHDWHYGVLPSECRDLNGDSYPDIAITADCSPSTIPHPKVYIYFGGPNLDTQADLVLEPDTASTHATEFGKYTSMGDFNGDGYCDIAVAAPGYKYLDFLVGKIYVFYGGPNMDNIPDWSITGQPNYIHDLGYDISISGDINNDGSDDIFTYGFSYPLLEGKLIFFGGFNPDTIPDGVISGFDVPGFWSGRSCIIPDINGDNCGELFMGTTNGYSCDGYLLFGSTIIDTMWDIHLYGDGVNCKGTNYCGDINDDGWSDVLLGDPNSGLVNGFFLGPNIGTSKIYDFVIEKPGIGGPPMGYAGDVNGDGVDDFMFATYMEEGPFNIYPGVVYIYSDTSLSSVSNPELHLSLPSFSLYQNYPNPFNSSTIISFNLKESENVNLSVYNILGEKLMDLMNNRMNEGSYRILWDGKDFQGFELPSGMYILNLSSAEQRETKIITLIR